jgi:hypothetical protein
MRIRIHACIHAYVYITYACAYKGKLNMGESDRRSASVCKPSAHRNQLGAPHGLRTCSRLPRGTYQKRNHYCPHRLVLKPRDRSGCLLMLFVLFCSCCRAPLLPDTGQSRSEAYSAALHISHVQIMFVFVTFVMDA